MNSEDILKALHAEADRRKIQEETEELSGSLSAFIRAAWHVLNPLDQYDHNWHIDAICQHLESVTKGEIQRLQVWIPPGSMKSLGVSVFWPAWEWTKNPGLRYWTASYEIGLAGRLASKSKTVIMDPWYQARWGHLFRMTKADERYYANNKGGSRLATAPGSTGIGEHGHRVIIDDAINARDAEATSMMTLGQANNWYDSTILGRAAKPNETAQVIIMQRLHPQDLAAHVLELDDWVVLCLPERYEANHPFAWPHDPRQEGELLWPAHRNEKASNTFARTLTSHRAAGQQQQRPAAREGEILKRAWWRFYNPKLIDTPNSLPKFNLLVQSWDTPLKDKESNDFVAGQCYGVLGGDRYLLDIRKARMNYSRAKRQILEMAQWARQTWPYSSHFVLIENAGYGVELIDELRREITGIVRIPPGPDGNKVMRAESASSDLESHNIFLPGRGLPDLSGPDEAATPADVVEFVNNCALFPNVAHDDDIDAWSQAMIWLRSRRISPLRTSSALKRLERRRVA